MLLSTYDARHAPVDKTQGICVAFSWNFLILGFDEDIMISQWEKAWDNNSPTIWRYLAI